jgi:hypothetical protein
MSRAIVATGNSQYVKTLSNMVKLGPAYCSASADLVTLSLHMRDHQNHDRMRQR